MSTRKIYVLVALSLFAGGCATVKPQEGFDSVSTEVQQRIGNQIHWYTGTEEDQQVKQSIKKLLSEPLTAESAVQIGLLNHQSLQSQYSNIGISQADMVQAGLLKNPLVEITRLKPREDDANSGREVSVQFEFLDILLIPLRKKVAAQNYAAAKQQVTAAVLDHAANVRKAFYAVQTSQQMESMYGEITGSTDAALETAKRLYKIGNINDGTYDNFRLSHDEASLSHAEAQLATRAAREELSEVMGVWGGDTAWSIAGGLKPIPFDAVNVADIQKRALENSLDLAMLKHQVKAIAQRAGIENIESIINDFEAGFIWDKEPSGEWKDGPTIEFKIPVFDTGEARRERVRQQLMQIKAMYRVKEVSIRSRASRLADRLTTSRAIVEQYIDNILPLNRSIKSYELLNYNAMQIDVFKLLRAHEKQISARQRFVQALSNYWMARADLETLLSGRAVTLSQLSGPAMNMGGGDDGGH